MNLLDRDETFLDMVEVDVQLQPQPVEAKVEIPPTPWVRLRIMKRPG